MSGSSGRRWIVGVLVTLLLIGGPPIGALGTGPTPVAAGAVRLFHPTDRIVAPIRGTWQRSLWFARHYGAQRTSEVANFMREVYRLAPLVGIDPAVVIAQSALETDTWRTRYWAEHLNPAGIGITQSGAPSYTWANGTDAARGQIVHLYLYAVGQIGSGHILAPYKRHDPRYQAAVDAGYTNIADTVDDLSGRWAVDTAYGVKIAGRGNDIYIRHRLLAMTSSANANSPRLADDMGASTAWQTVRANPRAAYLIVDLGARRPIGTIRWLFKESGWADQMRIEVSSDGSTWQRIGSFGNGPALSWRGVSVGVTARFVRWWFSNPNGDAKLGAVAEVQVWPPTSPALSVAASAAAVDNEPASSTETTPTAEQASPRSSRPARDGEPAAIATVTPTDEPVPDEPRPTPRSRRQGDD